MKAPSVSDVSDVMSTASAHGLNVAAPVFMPASNAAPGMGTRMAGATLTKTAAGRRRDHGESGERHDGDEKARQIQLEIETTRAQLASDPFRHVI